MGRRANLSAAIAVRSPEGRTLSVLLHDPSSARPTALRIVVMERDPAHAEIVRRWLALAGHATDYFERTDTLIGGLERDLFDVLVLDWNPYENRGLEMLRRIRASGQPSVPVLLASSGNREHDVVAALRQGADAFMVKPVRERELVARVEALGRRCRNDSTAPAALELGPYHVDCERRTLLRYGRSVALTRKDFDLCVLFLRNVGRLLSRGEICRSVWGRSVAVSSRSLDTHVCRLRGKLGLTAENGWCLTAVYRFGYRLQAVGPAAELLPASGSPARFEPIRLDKRPVWPSQG